MFQPKGLFLCTHPLWGWPLEWCWMAAGAELVASLSLLASQASYFYFNIGKPFDPHSQPLARRQKHFHSTLMSEQVLREHVVEMFNNGLVSVNFNTPMTNMVCGFPFLWAFPWTQSQGQLAACGHFKRLCLLFRLRSLHNLNRVFQRQRIRFFVAAGNNGRLVFVNFVAMQQLVVWQKKMVRLVEQIRRW